MAYVRQESDDELKVAQELSGILQQRVADELYDGVPEALGGRVLNADLARTLSPRYRDSFSRIAYTRCTYAPAAAYVLDRYLRTIHDPNWNPGKPVLFLAGGAASGKTTTAVARFVMDFPLIFDSNLADFAKARRLITEALNRNHPVFIDYIHRPFRLALRSMLNRAMEEGRFIPLGFPSKMVRLHMGAQRTILQIAAEFAPGDVVITIWANQWTPEHPVSAARVSISDLDLKGRFHYDNEEVLYAEQATILEEFKTANRGCPAALIEALESTEG